jgi:tripartite-type tricarboxylate transporter receptor subunit TctC
MPAFNRNSAMRAIGAALLLCAAQLCAAQAYPSKPVRFIIDTNPGGVTDILGRMAADSLSQQFGRSFVVENRAGGSGHIAFDLFVKAPPDGYTLMVAGGGNVVIQPFLQKSLGYDPLTDLLPVFNIAETPHILVIPASLPVKTLADFIAYARARPGKVNYGSAGIGSPPHLAADHFARLAGLEMIHVPYKGVGGTLPDLVAGRIQLVSMSLGSASSNLKTGTLRAIAAGSKKRLSGLPDVPTSAEAGLPGWEMSAWFGVFAPRDTSRDIVRAVNEKLQAHLDDPRTRQKFVEIGAEPIGGSPASFAERVRADYQLWGQVVKESGVKLE